MPTFSSTQSSNNGTKGRTWQFAWTTILFVYVFDGNNLRLPALVRVACRAAAGVFGSESYHDQIISVTESFLQVLKRLKEIFLLEQSKQILQ